MLNDELKKLKDHCNKTVNQFEVCPESNAFKEHLLTLQLITFYEKMTWHKVTEGLPEFHCMIHVVNRNFPNEYTDMEFDPANDNDARTLRSECTYWMYKHIITTPNPEVEW